MNKIYDTITTSIETITPQDADRYRAAELKNRDLRVKDVKRYAHDMSTCSTCQQPMGRTPSGVWACTACGGTHSNWLLTGEPVIFDWYGRQINGGHRMEACIRSGADFTTTVIRGVDPSTRIAIDTGVKRAFSDDLAMQDIASSRQIASLLRRALYWEHIAALNNGRGGVAGNMKQPYTRADLLREFPARETELSNVIKTSNRIRAGGSGWPGNSGALAFTIWLLLTREQNNPDTVDRFLRIIRDGSQDPADKVLLHVQKTIRGETTQWKKNQGHTRFEHEVFYLLRGWNAWLRREPLARLSFGAGGLTNPYPEPQKAR